MYKCRRLVLVCDLSWLLLDVLLLLFSLFEHLIKGVFQRRTFGCIVSRYFDVLTLIRIASFLTSSQLIKRSWEATRRDIPEAFTQHSNSFLTTIRTVDSPVTMIKLVPPFQEIGLIGDLRDASLGRQKICLSDSVSPEF